MRERILYVSIVWIIVLLLVMGVAGSATELAVIRLTDSPELDQHSDWNSEGSKIVFESERTGNRDIWIMNADGSGLTQLTTDPEKDWQPSWRFDGKIAFASKRSGKTQIWEMKKDGTGKKQITDNGKGNKWPVWRPDGSYIAYEVGKGDETIDIWVMKKDGRGQRQLTTDPGNDRYPTWSPDGNRIAFASDRDGKWDIWVINFDGTGLKHLTKNEGNNHVPSWKQGKIAFYSDRSGNQDIWIMDEDGTNVTQVTTDPANDECPFLSPDATQIAFCSDRSGDKELYLIDAPSYTPEKKRIVVLANSIDFELNSDFFGFLENKGIETVRVTASNFDRYKQEENIVILGGPDAPEGVGDIAQEVLPEDEQNVLRAAGAKRFFVRKNIWTQGQGVIVIAGSSRYLTKNSSDEYKYYVEYTGRFYTPSPSSVGVTLDPSRTSTVEVNSDNPTYVKAYGNNGTKYTLKIPLGSLPGLWTVENTMITLTPVTNMEGIPMSEGMVAAVHISPEGLNLTKPATLTIELPGGSVPTNLWGFGSRGNGDEFHLSLSKAGSSNITLSVSHFSVKGVGKGDLDESALGNPSKVSDYAEQELTKIVKGAIKGKELQVSGEDKHRMTGVLIDWFYDRVYPMLTPDGTYYYQRDDSEGIRAEVSAFIDWKITVERLAPGINEPFIQELEEIGSRRLSERLEKLHEKIDKECVEALDLEQKFSLFQKLVTVQYLVQTGPWGSKIKENLLLVCEGIVDSANPGVSIIVQPGEARIPVGGTVAFSHKIIRDSDGKELSGEIIWRALVPDSGGFSVDQNGLVTGISPISAYVVAQSKSFSHISGSVYVVVYKPEPEG